jgi:hypothetical protein
MRVRADFGLDGSYGLDQQVCKAPFWTRFGVLGGCLNSNGRINALVCPFNSFALARPFCESIKIPAEGEIGSRAAAGSDICADAVVRVWAERGDF